MDAPSRRLTLFCLLIGLAVLPARSVRAQISGATNSTTGTTCSGSMFWDCDHSVAFTNSTPTSFTSRYAWNINARSDQYLLPASTVDSAAQHNISFTVTAPAGFRLDVTTSRVGELSRQRNPFQGGDTVDTSAVSGFSSNGVVFGTLGLPDPGDIVGGATASLPYSQTGGAAIYGVSNGVPQSYTLTFTWDGSVYAHLSQGAIRQGENTQASCTNCQYPGSPPRTLETDGHFVTVTFAPLCGNGAVEPPAGEQCDLGGLNGQSTSCCTSTCRLRAPGSVCRASVGTCDVAETCTGSAPVCPANGLVPAATQCRASAGGCDPPESCTGSSGSCPNDFLIPANGVCRSAAGVCDIAERCSGSSPACPANAFQPSSTTCRGSAGPCDVAEQCTGSSPSCPANVLASSATICRAAAGNCDVAENCSGADIGCPPDSLEPAGVSCRDSAGACDVPETCTGSGAVCPADSVQPSTFECRASAGVCDVAETCSGSSTTCPSDAFVPSSTTCRASAGPCDVSEQCTGSGPSCPADGFASSTTVCRATTGDCDVAEHCSGVDSACPPDSLQPSTFQCRASGGACDPPENCDGVTTSCPADTLQPAETPCRPAAGVCDVAEACTGTASACPPDVVATTAVECRASAGVCDVAERCDGTTVTCPADAFGPPDSICRAAAGVCDVAETCSGSAASCPLDAPKAAGTVCRASADDCDLAETCDGASSTCPDDLPAPDGTPCDDAQACSFPDSCQAGVCSGPTSIGSCVGHFLCYRTKARSPFDRISSVHLADQLDDGIFDIVKPRNLCTPAATNGEEIADGATHLRSYQIRRAAGSPSYVRRTAIEMVNQIGTIVLDAVTPELLLVPASKDLDTPPPPPDPTAHAVDHYKCFKASVSKGTSKFQRVEVLVADQFASPAKRLVLKKVRHLCVPVDKDGEGIRNPAGTFVCYSSRPASGQPKHQKRTAFVNDGFGPGTVETIKEDELCIPSLMNP